VEEAREFGVCEKSLDWYWLSLTTCDMNSQGDLSRSFWLLSLLLATSSEIQNYLSCKPQPCVIRLLRVSNSSHIMSDIIFLILSSAIFVS
jgi:hypothetical protein